MGWRTKQNKKVEGGKKGQNYQNRASLEGIVHHHHFCYTVKSSQPLLNSTWVAQTTASSFHCRSTSNFSILTQSRSCVPVEAEDEEAMLITWPGLSTMI